MNILIMADYFPPGRTGGIGEVAAALADAYRRLGHRPYVLSTGASRSGEEARGIRRSHRSLIPGVLLNNLLARRMIRDLGIDLVHLQQASSTLFLLDRRPRSRPAVLYTLHVSYRDEADQIRPYTAGGRTFRPNWREYLERSVYMPVHRMLDGIGLRRADRVTVMSEASRRRLLDAGVPAAVVPNGPGGGGTRPAPDPELRAFLAGRRVLAFSGVFRIRKRLPVLLLALSELVRTHSDAALMVLGGGRGYEAPVRALVADLGLESHVWFAGTMPQPRVLAHLRLADVFCMVSTLEGMPVALLEAMSLGLAVIGTRVPGTADAIDNGRTGLLVEVDDVAGLAAALRRLLDDPALRKRLGRAAAARSAERFDWDRIATAYLTLVADRQLHGGSD